MVSMIVDIALVKYTFDWINFYLAMSNEKKKLEERGWNKNVLLPSYLAMHIIQDLMPIILLPSTPPLSLPASPLAGARLTWRRYRL